MRTRYGWCHNPDHTPYAHFEKRGCTAFTIWASQARPIPERKVVMTTHTVEQPFLRINSPEPCTITDRHATQIAPVLGNHERLVPVFVVMHGRDYLTLDGRVTTTPVWLTWNEAVAAGQAHTDAAAVLR